MDDSVVTKCSRCGAEIVVMSAGEYLSSSEDVLDFTLHGHRRSQLAIKSEDGAYACPSCGKHQRLPARPNNP